MMTLDTNFTLVLLALFVALLAGCFLVVAIVGGRKIAMLRDSLYALEDEVHSLQVRLDGASETARTLSRAVEQAGVIEQWRREMAKCPEGSPKHTAYVNRLREVGAL
jgi:hypothetical protein